VQAANHGIAGARRVDGTPVSKHRMMTLDRETGRVLVEFNSTKTHPWKKRAHTRARNRRAAISRKANR
jgi:hypothetical protein